MSIVNARGSTAKPRKLVLDRDVFGSGDQDLAGHQNRFLV